MYVQSDHNVVDVFIKFPLVEVIDTTCLYDVCSFSSRGAVGVLTSSYTKSMRLRPLRLQDMVLSPSDYMYNVVYAQWTNLSLLEPCYLRMLVYAVGSC